MKEFVIKIVPRLTYAVDSDKLDELAEKHGFSDHLSKFFHLTWSLNWKNWRHADERYIDALSDAITVKASRPTFRVTHEIK